MIILIDIRLLLKRDGVKNLLPQMKEEKAIYDLSATHGIRNLFPLKEEKTVVREREKEK
jgi:hypothetical protein